MNLFLDTEFADCGATQLVSLALVSEDGRQEFYAERDPLPAEPTAFVAKHVYPLLNRGDAAADDATFTTRLRAFLATVEYPHVIYDFPFDWHLFDLALRGFDLPAEIAAACGPVPRLSGTLANGSAVTEYTEAWFAAHPDAKRHHALMDARAYRAGWLRAHR